MAAALSTSEGAMYVEIRPGAISDAAAIRALTREAYARWTPITGREPTPMTADYDLAVRTHRFDLAYAEGALVGLIELVDEGDVLLVENVAVRPDWQGRGLGRRLMALAEDVARELGHKRVRLFTNKLWAANVQLYLRLGYRIDREAPIDGGMFRVDMSKALAGA
jgi:GNAT superfamily N-acetyltransferase